MDFDSLFNTIILLEANAEKRLAYLNAKYENVIDELIQKKFNSSVNYFVNIYGEKPLKFIIDDVDPTDGEYSEWIVKSLLKDIDNGRMDEKAFWRFFSEDFHKVSEDLEKYHKYKRLFKKAAIDRNNPETAKLADINRIGGFDDLYNKLKVIGYYIQEQEDSESLARAEKEVDKIYTSENYLVVVPKTEEASCAYGRETRWCTASTGSYNYFNQYNRQGPLYIIINRKTQEKFQFHFESEQFMNADDSQVNIPYFFKSNEELKNVFLDIALAKGAWSFIEKMEIKSDILSEKIDSLPEEKRKKVIGKYIPVAFLYGLKNPKFVNENQKLMVFEDDNTITLVTPYREFSDLAMFIGQDNSKYYERVLAGDEDFYGVAEYITYEREYLDWIDEKNLKKIKEYVRRATGVKVSSESDAEEALETLEYKDANGWMEGWITAAYKEVYESEYRDAVQNYYISTIAKILGGGQNYKWNYEDRIIFPGWKRHKFESDIINYILQHPINENDYFPLYDNFFREFASILHNEGDLNEPDESHIYPELDPSNKDQKDIFNSRLSELIDMPPDNDPQMKLDLGLEIDESQVNRNMLQFDLYVKKILSEDLGNRGPAVKSAAPQTPVGTTSPSPTTSSTPQPQGGTGIGVPTSQPAQNQQNQQPDYLTIFSNPESMKQFSSDPNNIQGFKTFLSDPNNVKTLTSQIKDPGVMASMIGLLNQ